MGKQSAGLLMFRRTDRGPEVLRVHPGGLFWAKKDEGAWTIPKGEPAEREELLHAAQREFSEETGFEAHGPFHDLGPITQAGRKKVAAWAFEGDCDPAALKSNLCEIEWPPRSKRTIQIQEVDRGAWFSFPEARMRILKSQVPLLDKLDAVLTALGAELLPRGEERCWLVHLPKVAQPYAHQPEELRRR